MLYRIIFILFISISLLNSTVSSQDDQHALLESFTVSQIDNNVLIDFSIIGGASCQGVKLERSPNNSDFEQIGQITGVCGGSEFIERYQLIDDSPIENANNFYRLVLGQQGKSGSISINFIPLFDGYRVYPVPAKTWTIIKFENSNLKRYNCLIYNLNGKLVQEINNIISQEIFVNLSSYPLGTFIFQLQSDDSDLITGKFIVG